MTHICDCMEPVSMLVEPEGARVITRDELQALALGKLDIALHDIQRLKKELRGRLGGNNPLNQQPPVSPFFKGEVKGEFQTKEGEK